MIAVLSYQLLIRLLFFIFFSVESRHFSNSIHGSSKGTLKIENQMTAIRINFEFRKTLGLCKRQRIPRVSKSRATNGICAGKMDENQAFAVETILKKHNLVLTGQAGTGKSHVIKEVIN
jgi:Cdc6-like AAA superfamily ATPase